MAASADGGQQVNSDQSSNLDASSLRELLELLFKLEQEKINSARLIAFIFKSFTRLQSGKCVELMKDAVKKSGLDTYCQEASGYTILERIVSVANSVLRTKTLQGSSVERAIVVDEKGVVDTRQGGSTKRAIQINDTGVDTPAVITLPGGSPEKAIVVEDSCIDASVETLSDKMIVIEDTGADKLVDTLSSRSPEKVIVVEDTEVEAHEVCLPGRSTSGAIVIEDTGLGTDVDTLPPDRSPSKVIVVEDTGVDAPVDTLSTGREIVIETKQSVETHQPVRSPRNEILIIDDTQTDISPKNDIVIEDTAACVDTLRSTENVIVVDDTTRVHRGAIVIDETGDDTPVVVETGDVSMNQELLELHAFMNRMILAVISKVKQHPEVTMVDDFVSRSSTEVPKLSPGKDSLVSQPHSTETRDLYAVQRHSPETGDTLAVQRQTPETRDLLEVQRLSPETPDLLAVQHKSPETPDLLAVQRHSPETPDLLTVQHKSPETRYPLAVQRHSPETRDLFAVEQNLPETRDLPAVHRHSPELEICSRLNKTCPKLEICLRFNGTRPKLVIPLSLPRSILKIRLTLFFSRPCHITQIIRIFRYYRPQLSMIRLGTSLAPPSPLVQNPLNYRPLETRVGIIWTCKRFYSMNFRIYLLLKIFSRFNITRPRLVKENLRSCHSLEIRLRFKLTRPGIIRLRFNSICPRLET